MDTFELKKEHVKLASSMHVGWNDAEYGAPEIDPKRPYGNSDVESDICEILGWKMEGQDSDDDDAPCYSAKQMKKAGQIHLEMETALQIILCCHTFELGTYEKLDEYDSLSWSKV